MKKLLLILLLAFVSTAVSAQNFSVSFAPYSFKLWGVVDRATSVGIDYKLSFLYNRENSLFRPPVAGLHYFHQWDRTVYRITHREWETTKTSTVALSLVPLDLKYFRLGGIVAKNNFPLSLSPRANFYLQLVLPVKRFDIRYTHISNGMGFTHEVNPGLDMLSLHYKF